MGLPKKKTTVSRGRPTKRPGMAKDRVSISVSPVVLEAARDCGNMSEFFESAARAANGISKILAEHFEKGLDSSEALERIDDVLSVWRTIGEEEEEF